MNLKPLITLFLLASSVLVAPVTAAPYGRKIAFSFKPPTSGRPTFTIGGAVRGDVCAADQVKRESILAYLSDSTLTAKSHPEFFVSVPELNQNKQATLIVKDDSEDYYQVQSVVIPQEGGLLKLALDTDKPELTPGVEYQWFLRLQCGQTAGVEDPLISGNVTRTTLSVPGNISLEDSLALYAQNDLWYDSLAAAHDLASAGQSQYWNSLVEASTAK